MIDYLKQNNTDEPLKLKYNTLHGWGQYPLEKKELFGDTAELIIAITP